MEIKNLEITQEEILVLMGALICFEDDTIDCAAKTAAGRLSEGKGISLEDCKEIQESIRNLFEKLTALLIEK